MSLNIKSDFVFARIIPKVLRIHRVVNNEAVRSVQWKETELIPFLALHTNILTIMRSIAHTSVLRFLLRLLNVIWQR